MLYALWIIIIIAISITAKFMIILHNINKKKREQRIITPSERMQLRNWSIIFAGTLSGVVIGLGSALISYL